MAVDAGDIDTGDIDAGDVAALVGAVELEATDASDWPEKELTDAELEVLALAAELEVLALAAELEGPVPENAVPLSLHAARYPGVLSPWYMAPVAARRCSGWRMPVVVGIVVTLVVLEALGLCSVFGQVVVG